jgi:hypothetical protein
MKPLNLDNSPCSPISSNCVIWQGQDIPCIKLCKGDTISDVIFKLATELCTIMETLKISNYDLECFNLVACPPSNFQELIQFLIDKICELQVEVDATVAVAVAGGTTKSTSADTLVTVAPCFIVGTTTVMTVVEYATAMGTAICGIINQITIINADIINLDIRVTTLETALPPTFTLPSIAVNCNLSGVVVSPGAYPLDVVVDALINDGTYGYCALTSATGSPADITAAVLSQCVANADLSLLFGSAFSIAYAGSWISSPPTTIAAAINNLWIVLCDVYQYAGLIRVIGTNTDSIDVTVTAAPTFTITADLTDTGWTDLEGFAYYTGVTVPQCRKIGNTIYFRGEVYIPLDDGVGNVVNLLNTSSYNNVMQVTPFIGIGGVTQDANGRLLFNNGASIIPITVVALADVLDSDYKVPVVLMSRQLTVVNGVGVGTAFMSAVANVEITTAKTIRIATLELFEINSSDTNSFTGESAARFLTTNARSGEFLPNYIGATSNVQNFPAVVNSPLNTDTHNIVWPISCNAGAPLEVGGFKFSLDGLTAFVL